MWVKAFSSIRLNPLILVLIPALNKVFDLRGLVWALKAPDRKAFSDPK